MSIKVGRYTYGHESIQVFDYGCGCKIEIGSFTSISKSVKIYANQGKGHNHNSGTTYPFGITTQSKSVFTNLKPNHDQIIRNIRIGNDVWIGDGVTINPGIYIGDGAVIATNSHVIKDVPDYAVIGGNPAKILKYRFSPDIIKEFLTLEWWKLNDCQINSILPLLQSEPTLEIFDEIYKVLGIKKQGVYYE